MAETLHTIDVYEGVDIVAQLGWVTNSSEAQVVYAGGYHWIHKPMMGYNEVLSEAVGLLFGNMLGVSTPVGAVCREGSNVSWMSRIVDDVSHWSHEYYESSDNRQCLSGIYVLDAVIMNEDRHAQNVLMQDLGNGLYRIFSIDTADAYIGTPSDLVHNRRAPNPRNHFRPVPMDAETVGDARQLALRVTRFTRESLARCAAQACAAAACPEMEHDLTEALVSRCASAPVILEEYLQRLGAL